MYDHPQGGKNSPDIWVISGEFFLRGEFFPPPWAKLDASCVYFPPVDAPGYKGLGKVLPDVYATDNLRWQVCTVSSAAEAMHIHAIAYNVSR